MKTFDSAAWYGALNLSERVALQGQGTPRVNQKLASQRWQHWTQQFVLPEELWQQKLDSDKVAAQTLQLMLGESMESLQLRMGKRPFWLHKLERAYQQGTPSYPLQTDEQGRHFQLLNLYAPLLQSGWQQLHDAAQSIATQAVDCPFDPDNIVDILFANLPERLFKMVSRVAVLELNVARLQGQLEGETPEARFAHFGQRLLDFDVMLPIWQEYPILTRQVQNCIDQWVRASQTFLWHLHQDWAAIQAQFSPTAAPGLLTAVQSGVGDQHRDGRSVIIAHFESGFKVVYKPKSLAVEGHFQQFLCWLNEQGQTPALRTLGVLNWVDHGWVEFITAVPCQTKAQLHHFYQRVGAYLALFYVLEATDFHFENLIAAGEHPMPIDIESLFHAWPELPDSAAVRQLNDSVLRVGLLPQPQWSKDLSRRVDLSGLNTPDGQLSTMPMPYMEGVGTDEMHLEQKPLPIIGGSNRPTLRGEEIDPLAYSEDILIGFTATYDLLVAQREALLAADGPLAPFAHDEVRIILRPTQTYANLLNKSYHPDWLRDGLERDRFFDQLWFATRQQSHLIPLIAHERTDLHNGDIPLFTTCPTSHDLRTSRGERIPDFFERTAMERVQERLHALGEADLARQQWFIRASLSALALGQQRLGWRSYEMPIATQPMNKAQLVAAAEAIADRLATLALHDGQGATWVGLTMVGDHQWSLMPLGLDLYAGLPGIALFLAYVGHLTTKETYTTLARETVRTVLHQVQQEGGAVGLPIGGYDGLGGLIYALTQLGVLWQDEALLTEAEGLVPQLAATIENDAIFDVIGGSAGAILGLLALYEQRPQRATLATAVTCGKWLLTNAQPVAQTVAWPSMSGELLTGFSHGAAGCAHALFRLAAVIGDEADSIELDGFRETAVGALNYERALFKPETGNWPDLREMDGITEREDGIAWCHGAMGIGLSRLHTLPYYEDEVMREEIAVAVETTQRYGFGMNHSLCHGDLGNLLFLAQYYRQQGDVAQKQQIYVLANGIGQSVVQEGWLCGVPQNVETPGLLTGLAGIGYGFLMLAYPDVLPNVLMLQGCA